MTGAPPHLPPSRLRRRERRPEDRAPVSAREPVDPEQELRRALREAFGRVAPPVTSTDLTEAGRYTFARLAYSRTAVAAGLTPLPADVAARVRREVIDELVSRRLAAAG